MAERFDPRFDPAFQPGFDPSRDATPPEQRAEGAAASEPIAEPPAAPTPEDSSEEAEGSAAERNPFERTLWIASAALVVGGAALTYWANSANIFSPAPSVEVPWNTILQQSAWSLSQPMITVGLGTAVALLFRRAAAWKSAE